MEVAGEDDLLGRRFDHVDFEKRGDALGWGETMTGDLSGAQVRVVIVYLGHLVDHVGDVVSEGRSSFKEMHGRVWKAGG